jgi:ATP adenylyltransferase
MRMSHIYQPVMLITLLENNGKCHEKTIAGALLSNDQSQIEYFKLGTGNVRVASKVTYKVSQ